MTTATYASVIDHSSDAGFRAWVAELITNLAAAGLVQTADTGQIDTATVTRPATNSNAGYAVFRFNDAQQASAPIYLRIDFGTGGALTTPRMQLTVGTATNGAGTLSGHGIAATTFANSAYSSSATNYTTQICVADGQFGLFWKLGGTGSLGMGFCAISRSVDSSGVATADGAQIYTWTAGTGPVATVARYAAGDAVAMTTGSYCMIHGGHATSLVSGAAQVFKHYMTLPRVRPNNFMLTVLSGEIGNNVTFTAAPVGATSRTYISGGAAGFNFAGLPASSSAVIAMLWE